MNTLQIFNFEGEEIRTVIINGEPWFVGKDIAESLGYTWNGTQRIEHVPTEWRGVTSVVTSSGTQEMVVLSEQGLYFFLGRSDKEKALPFQKWIAGDVLPSIRKTGTYSVDGYRKKSTSVGEVASMVKTLTTSMRKQGSNERKVAKQIQLTCNQFGIEIIPDFIEPEPPYTQIQLAEMGYYQGRR